MLTQTEARIKADSGNVNHQGIDISASHDAYMDFSTQKGTLADTVKEAKLRTAAQTVAADVGQVIASGQLSKAEVTKLQNVMAEIVGDAESAAEYISINLHDGGAMGTEIGATAQTYVDSGNGVGDNGVDGLATFKYFKDEQLKTEANKAYFWSGLGEVGAEIAASIAKENGGVTLETTIAEQKVNIPKFDINNPIAVEAWQRASALYAKQASGEVRAIVSSNLRSTSIWNTVELPALMANQNDMKIIVVDPKTLVETILFSR